VSVPPTTRRGALRKTGSLLPVSGGCWAMRIDRKAKSALSFGAAPPRWKGEFLRLSILLVLAVAVWRDAKASSNTPPTHTPGAGDQLRRPLIADWGARYVRARRPATLPGRRALFGRPFRSTFAPRTDTRSDGPNIVVTRCEPLWPTAARHPGNGAGALLPPRAARRGRGLRIAHAHEYFGDHASGARRPWSAFSWLERAILSPD